jgi:hypothetical protein
MGWLVKIYNDLKNYFALFIYLYKRIKNEGMIKQDIATLLKSEQELKFMERRFELYNDFIRGQQLQIQQLEQEINMINTKIALG